jgi:DNA-binding NtrC family response regulator
MPESSPVLILDDNPSMVALVGRWLVRAGYHVTGVTTAEDAREALTAQPFAWVITDLRLPTGDGLDILAYAHAHQPHARVVILTAFGSEAARQRALTQGAHAFLSKPFSGETPLALLTREQGGDTPRPLT